MKAEQLWQVSCANWQVPALVYSCLEDFVRAGGADDNNGQHTWTSQVRLHSTIQAPAYQVLTHPLLAMLLTCPCGCLFSVCLAGETSTAAQVAAAQPTSKQSTTQCTYEGQYVTDN